jgi:hypothetical protein
MSCNEETAMAVKKAETKKTTKAAPKKAAPKKAAPKKGKWALTLYRRAFTDRSAANLIPAPPIKEVPREVSATSQERKQPGFFPARLWPLI